jgi:uncharacterized protein
MDLNSSPLVSAANEARRPTRWWWAIVVTMGVGVVAVGTLVEAIVPVVPGSIAEQLLEVVTNGLALVVLALWVVFKERRRFSSVGFRGGRALPRAITGFALGAVLVGIVAVILVAIGVYTPIAAPAGSTSGLPALLPALLLVAAVAVQSSAEETITRGYLLQVFAQQMPAWAAILVPSVIFTLAHVTFDPLILINTTLIAVAFCFVALGQGSLWLVCGLHTGFNWLQGNGIGIPVSGHAHSVSLAYLAPTEASPAWLTGGDYGIEGSAVLTLVLIVFLAACIGYYRRCEARRIADPHHARHARHEQPPEELV